MTGVTVTPAFVPKPPLQLYVPPPAAVNVALEPLHIVPSLFVVPDVSATVMDGVGSGLTVIVVDVLDWQLFTSVTVTV